MEIKISELKDLTCKLLSRIETLGYSSVNIPHNFYWDIMAPERYEVGITAQDAANKLNTPKLSDDLEVIQEIDEKKLPDYVYALVHLAALIRATGEEISLLVEGRVPQQRA
jgi:hypothetical protein